MFFILSQAKKVMVERKHQDGDSFVCSGNGKKRFYIFIRHKVGILALLLTSEHKIYLSLPLWETVIPFNSTAVRLGKISSMFYEDYAQHREAHVGALKLRVLPYKDYFLVALSCQ